MTPTANVFASGSYQSKDCVTLWLNPHCVVVRKWQWKKEYLIKKNVSLQKGIADLASETSHWKLTNILEMEWYPRFIKLT